MNNEFIVKNSFDFIQEIVSYDRNLLVSLNVELLFRNIHCEETIKNCVNDLLSNKCVVN